MADQKILSVADLVSTIGRLDSIVDYSGELSGRLRWWFRGQLNSSWDLVPSGKRGYTAEQERFLSNEFYVRAGTRYRNCPDKDNFAAWLTLMQHYGLPTRLLDWTSSPLVALFFAVEHCLQIEPNQLTSSACIWCLAPGVLNESQGMEPYVYPLDAASLEVVLRPAMKGRDTTNKIVAAMAVENDPRIQTQQGAFTVHSSMTPLNQFETNEEWLVKIEIPVQAAHQLCREAQLLGIQRGFLFPDLANLSEELKLNIKPKF